MIFYEKIIKSGKMGSKNYSPTSFVENATYSVKKPYIVNIKTFKQDETTILHYAQSIEILLCDGLKGFVLANDKKYQLDGKQIFVIPQNVVHQTLINKCDGKMYVLKIHPESLEKLIDLKTLVGRKFLKMGLYSTENFESLKTCVFELNKSDNLFERSRLLLSVLEMLYADVAETDDNGDEVDHNNVVLRKVVDWTTENCGTYVLMQDVADYVGYSKFYFSRWFKKVTGITYYAYLSLVRVDNAKRFLVEGNSIADVAHLCGYENVSHFISMFYKY